MRRVWLIRAGQDGAAIDPMRHAGQIAMPARAPVQFTNDIHVGDLVVSPNTARHEVWVGIITSASRTDEVPAVADHAAVRDVDWLGWLDRDASWMKDQLKSLDRPPVLYELPSREWWWRQVDSRQFGTQPRAVRAGAPTRSRSAAGTARAPRAAAAKPTSTRKQPVAMVRCAGSCGFQWAPTSLIDGLCADCRAD